MRVLEQVGLKSALQGMSDEPENHADCKTSSILAVTLDLDCKVDHEPQRSRVLPSMTRLGEPTKGLPRIQGPRLGRKWKRAWSRVML